MSRSIVKEKLQAIMNLLDKGYTIPAIAEQLGIKVGTLYSYMHRAEIKYSDRCDMKHKLVAKHADIVRMFSQGISPSQICKKLDLGYSSLLKYARINSIEYIKAYRDSNLSVTDLVQNAKHLKLDENRFCVYKHIDSSGVCFYVGHGTEDRALTEEGRTKNWKTIANEGYSVEFVAKALSKSEAYDLEAKVIHDNLETVVNKIKKNTRPVAPDFCEISERFYYDNTSPSGLRYKIKTQKKNPGDVAGYLGNNGYYYVSFKGKHLLVHRLVYLLCNGSVDALKIVDHEDGNSSNNNYTNLRLIDKNKNSKNLKVRSDSSTCSPGVSFSALRNQFNVRLSYNGLLFTKTFSAKKYGKDEAFRLAKEWREALIKELNEKHDAGFTDRHINGI